MLPTHAARAVKVSQEMLHTRHRCRTPVRMKPDTRWHLTGDYSATEYVRLRTTTICGCHMDRLRRVTDCLTSYDGLRGKNENQISRMPALNTNPIFVPNVMLMTGHDHVTGGQFG